MASSTTYTVDERSKGNRLAKRTEYDADLVHSIVDEAPILHVSFNAPCQSQSSQFPTILPMLGAVGQYPASQKEPANIYLHGSSAARLARLTADALLPVCIAATILDGYVLALSPFHNSCNYRSAICFGTASLVTDPEEIHYALGLITNNSVPARWEHSRGPPTKAELTATGVLKVVIETASAKTRAGGPSDDRADLRDEAVAGSTWVGVVPAYLTLGEPVAAGYNRVERVPEYLGDWVADRTGINEQRAVDAAMEG